jgi:hypothetical protein
VVLFQGADLILPSEVNSLDVLFEFDGVKLGLSKFVYVLDWDGSPAELADSGQATLASNKNKAPAPARDPTAVITGYTNVTVPQFSIEVDCGEAAGWACLGGVV